MKSGDTKTMTELPIIQWPGGRPPMPNGPIKAPEAWYADEMADSSLWLYQLSEADVSEINRALDGMEKEKLGIIDLNPGNFPLPSLKAKLMEVRDHVVNRRGLYTMRGMPVEQMGFERAAAAYYGISTYLGATVPQNGRGHVLGHVQDIGGSIKNPNNRAYMTRDPLPFHCDSCDVVGLLCVQKSMEGGASAIASSVTVYNEMLKRRPDLAALLFEIVYVDRRGEVPEGKLPYYPLPVFNWYDGKLTTFYQRMHIESCQRFPEVPRLTEKYIEALDLYDAIGLEENVCLKMSFQPGDMQYCNNHSLLHSRTGFIDWPEPERKRHLLRIWLSPDIGRALPDYYAERYGSVELGHRGGVRVPGMLLQAPLRAA